MVNYTQNPNDIDGKTGKIGTDTYVLLHMQGAKSPIIFRPKQRVTLGRHHDLTPRKPDIDLIPFGAHDQGVSRIHAAIVMKDDDIFFMDMGSCNGTWLNGQRLVAGRPYLLNDGDQVRLGRLNMKVGVKVKASAPEQFGSMQDTMTVPVVRREHGAGMLNQQSFEVEYTHQDTETTLVIPEFQRTGSYQLPNFVEHVGQNRQVGQVDRDDFSFDQTTSSRRDLDARRADTFADDPTTKPDRASQLIRPLKREQPTSPDATIFNRSSVIRPLSRPAAE